MRIIGMLGVLLALVIGAWVFDTQLRATRTVLPGVAPIAPASSARAPVRQAPQQVKEALDAAMQQSLRKLPDDAK